MILEFLKILLVTTHIGRTEQKRHEIRVTKAKIVAFFIAAMLIALPYSTAL